MKKIEFKKINAELKKEGIAIELLNKVQLLGKLTPVMFQKGDEPVKLVECDEDSFWVLLDDGTFLKDGKNNFIKYDLRTCIIARARYWLLFADFENEQKKEMEIKKEVDKIKANLKKEVEAITNKIENIIRYSGTRECKHSVLNDLEELVDKDSFEKKKEAAIKFLEENKDTERIVNELNNDLINNDFDSLYIKLKTGGLPILLELNYNNESGMELAKRFLHKDNICKTIELIQGKSHIESVAYFNVSKRYV